MVEALTAVTGAKVRVLQWVAATGVDWVVSLTISSMRAGVMVRGLPERGLQRSAEAHDGERVDVRTGRMVQVAKNIDRKTSCRERVCQYVEIAGVGGELKKKTEKQNEDNKTRCEENRTLIRPLAASCD